MRLCAVVLIVLAAPAYAEPTLKLPVDKRPVAARLSDWTLVAAVSVRGHQAWQSDDRKGELLEMGCEAGLTLGAVEALKLAIKRTRPDGSDRKSFPSGHTGFAQAMGGWRVAIPVAAMRQMAWKHYLTDTIGGALIALVATKVCT